MGTRVGSGSIDQAEWVERGSSLISLKQRIMLMAALKRLSLGLDTTADYCHVVAKVRPVPGSEVTVGAWLPQPWNGKLLGWVAAGSTED